MQSHINQIKNSNRYTTSQKGFSVSDIVALSVFILSILFFMYSFHTLFIKFLVYFN